jgi:hypothetical protein
MADLTFSQLEALWKQVAPGGLQILAPVMAAIALAESSGNPGAINPDDNNGTQSSYGLWQISNGTHSPPAPNWNDPTENAKLAVAKLQEQTLTAWGTYTSGAYKKFLTANNATDTSGDVAAVPYGTPAAGSTSTSPLDAVGGTISEMATLLGDAAKTLDWFFHFFKPGQGWRILFGAGAGAAAYGGVRAWMSAADADDASSALPLSVLLFGLAFLCAFMTLRQWPTSGGKPILPGAYAVDIVEGKPPAAGAAPGSDAPAIEAGLAALIALWGASKIASGLGGLGGLLGGLAGFLKTGASDAAEAGAGE